MRVLIAPDAFVPVLSASEAAAAIAAGWAQRAPADDLDLAPLTNGGPGLLAVLQEGLGGELLSYRVRGPYSEPLTAQLLLDADTAWIEASQVCGAELVGSGSWQQASSYGVGELLSHAKELNVPRVVIGLGDAQVVDGGAGLLAALGAQADQPLDRGVAALAGISKVELASVSAAWRTTDLVAASEEESTLTGLFGVLRSLGAAGRLAEADIVAADGWLTDWATALDRRVSLRKGSGAGGGIGFAVLALGGRQHSTIELCFDAFGLPERARRADLVVTGEHALDFTSRSGTVPYAVAALAAQAVRPCIALATRVDVASREMRALGIESAYSVLEHGGGAEAAEDPYTALVALAARVARTWSR